MGIAKYLKQGFMTIDSEKLLVKVEGVKVFSFERLEPYEQGQVFEKFVGQQYESEGYVVKYNGLEMGFLDRGIDIIAEDNKNIFFIQCKYHNKTFSKNSIEWILYKASNFIDKYKDKNHRKLHFVLAVKSISKNFSAKKVKRKELKIKAPLKPVRPLYNYILEKNQLQRIVRIDIKEYDLLNEFD